MKRNHIFRLYALVFLLFLSGRAFSQKATDLITLTPSGEDKNLSSIQYEGKTYGTVKTSLQNENLSQASLFTTKGKKKKKSKTVTTQYYGAVVWDNAKNEIAKLEYENFQWQITYTNPKSTVYVKGARVENALLKMIQDGKLTSQ